MKDAFEAHAATTARQRVALPRRLRGPLLLGVALALVMLALKAAGAPVLDLTRDVTDRTGAPAWMGAISTLGLLLQAAAVGALALGVSLVGAERRPYLIATAALVALVCLDDAFLLHEEAAPSVGIPEEVAVSALGGLALVWLWRFRRPVLSGQPLLLGGAALALGASVVLDAVERAALAEDWLKLWGLVLLAGWCLEEARAAPSGSSA